MKYLLDTCVISELVRKQPNSKVVSWIDAQDELDLYISVITLGEIQKGVAKLDDSRKKQKIQLWLEELTERFHGRILDLDLNTLLKWGKLSGELSKQGINIPAIDSLIAASAKNNHLYLITRNTDDFKYCGVEMINPWEEVK
jgi:predicted nucleic acid-binding protein